MHQVLVSVVQGVCGGGSGSSARFMAAGRGTAGVAVPGYADGKEIHEEHRGDDSQHEDRTEPFQVPCAARLGCDGDGGPRLVGGGIGQGGLDHDRKTALQVEPGHLGRNGDLPAVEMQGLPAFEAKSRPSRLATALPGKIRRSCVGGNVEGDFGARPQPGLPQRKGLAGSPDCFLGHSRCTPRASAPCHVLAEQFGFDLPRRRGNVMKPQLGDELAAGPHRKTLPWRE